MPPIQPHGLTIALAAAVNNRAVLANCLERSPDVVAGALPLRTYEGARTAGDAYNQALDACDAEILILAHQDVYLPSGFLEGLRRQLAALNAVDPDWSLAGVMGIDETLAVRGRTWSSGLGQLVGAPVETPSPVRTLDEMLLVVRRASGIRFDPEMPSFHLYAADAVLTARARGQNSYVIDAPVIHHSRPVVALDGGYRAAYDYMRRKWRAILPIPNLVCPITRFPLTLWLRDARIRRKHRGKPRPAEPMDDPSVIARRLGFENS